MTTTNLTAWEVTMIAHRSAADCERILGRKLTGGEYMAVRQMAAILMPAHQPKPTAEWYAAQKLRVFHGRTYCTADVW